MTLSKETVNLAYQLLLNREPADVEVTHVQEQHDSLSALRTAFMRSEEFSKQYEKLREQQNAEMAPTLIHIHIPKTAGTTLAQALEKEPSLQPNMLTNDHEVSSLLAMPRSKRRALRYIRGHISMGLGETLDIPHKYLCVMRQPQRRLFSFYQFIVRTNTHPMFGVVNHQKLNFGGFLEFCAREPSMRLEVDNGQVRRLAGDMDRPSIGQEAELLKDALCNALSPKMILGFAEDFDKLKARLIADGYLTQEGEIERFNSSPDAEKFDAACAEFTPEQQNLLDNFTMWDAYLYEVCRALLAPTS